MIRVPEPVERRRPWAAAFLLSIVFAAVCWQMADHPLPPLLFWPVAWVLLGVAVTRAIPAGRRSRAVTALAFGASGLVLACVGGLGLAVALLAGEGRDDPIDRVSSADGQYEVRVFHWQTVLAESGWDIVIRRRDGVEAFAGCLWSEGTEGYEKVQSVEAGSVRLATVEGPVSISFDPRTMQVTKGVHQCGAYR